MPPAPVENLRQKIWTALREDAGRSNSAVGRLLGCSHHSVAALRRELEKTDRIARFDFRGGRPGKEAR
jgi:DNA-binding Lrp family transcriptional regulator